MEFIMTKDEDLKKILEIQEKTIKSSKMQDENISELLEIQKRTLKLIEKTQELLIKSIDRQNDRMDSLKSLMNVEYVCLVFVIVFCSVFIR